MLHNYNEKDFKQSGLVGWIQANITIFPVLTACILPVLCIFVYELSLYYGHADKFFPYISDSAASEPEVEFFPLFTTAIAITMAITGWGRYRQLRYYLRRKFKEGRLTRAEYRKLTRFNVSALVALLCSCTGALTTGFFSVATHLFAHCFGVFLIGLMTIGEIYMILLGHQLNRRFGFESYPWSMGLIWLAQFVTGAVTLFATLDSLIEAGFDHLADSEYRLHWQPWQKGYRAHLLSAGAEWVTLNLNNLYMICLYRRMKDFRDWNRVWYSAQEDSKQNSILEQNNNNNNNNIQQTEKPKMR